MLHRRYHTLSSFVESSSRQCLELATLIKDDKLDELTASLAQISSQLNHERRILILGDAQSGKSTILANLVQVPAIAKRYAADAFTRWRYRPDSGEVSCSCFVPVPQLEGMELIDTKGLAGLSMRKAILPILPSVDICICVVDARKLAQSSIWDFLKEADDKMTCSVLMALTHTDHMPVEDVLRLRREAQELARDSFKRDIPVFPLASPDDSPAFENFLSALQGLMDSPRVAGRDLKEAGLLCANLIHSFGTALAIRERAIQSERMMLAGVDREIDSFLEGQLRSLVDLLTSYQDIFDKKLPYILDMLCHSIGFCFTPGKLLSRESLASRTEMYYFDLVLDEIVSRHIDLDVQFVLACGTHWKEVAPRMNHAMSCEIGVFDAAGLELELAQVRQRTGKYLHEAVLCEKMRPALSKIFQRALDWMMPSFVSICLTLIAASIVGFMGYNLIAFCFLGLAFFLWFMVSCAQWLELKYLHRHVTKIVKKMAPTLNTALVGALRHMVVARVSAYRSLYSVPRHLLEDQEKNLKELQKKQHDLHHFYHSRH